MQHGQKSASPKDHSNLDFYPNLLVVGGAERENTVNVLADINVYCKCSDKMANVTTNPVTRLRIMLRLAAGCRCHFDHFLDVARHRCYLILLKSSYGLD